MAFEDFQSEKHKNLQLYELASASLDSLIVTVALPSNATYEQASKSPWNFMVKEDNNDTPESNQQIQPDAG